MRAANVRNSRTAYSRTLDSAKARGLSQPARRGTALFIEVDMDDAAKLRILVKQLQREIKELREANERLYFQCEQAQACVHEAKLDWLLYSRSKP